MNIFRIRFAAILAAILSMIGFTVMVAPQASAVTAVIYQAHCGLPGTTEVGGSDDKTILPGQVGWVEFDFYTTIDTSGGVQVRKPGAPTAGGTNEFRFYNHADVWVQVQEMRYRYLPTGQSVMKDVVTAFYGNWSTDPFLMQQSQITNQLDRVGRNFTRYGNGDWKMHPLGYEHIQAVGYTQYWNRYFSSASDPNILVLFDYYDHSGVRRLYPCYAALNP